VTMKRAGCDSKGAQQCISACEGHRTSWDDCCMRHTQVVKHVLCRQEAHTHLGLGGRAQAAQAPQVGVVLRLPAAQRERGPARLLARQPHSIALCKVPVARGKQHGTLGCCCCCCMCSQHVRAC
jgi:hypothetical protein